MKDPMVSFKINQRVGHGSKTDTWEVCGVGSSFHLGQVRWHAPWRKYCFFPDSECLFDESCLKNIAAFLEWETMKQKKGKQAFPSEATA